VLKHTLRMRSKITTHYFKVECLVVVVFFFFRMGVYNGLIKSILECSFVIHDNATPIWLQWFVGMDVTSCWNG